LQDTDFAEVSQRVYAAYCATVGPLALHILGQQRVKKGGASGPARARDFRGTSMTGTAETGPARFLPYAQNTRTGRRGATTTRRSLLGGWAGKKKALTFRRRRSQAENPMNCQMEAATPYRRGQSNKADVKPEPRNNAMQQPI
jgi:hypothetical protein